MTTQDDLTGLQALAETAVRKAEQRARRCYGILLPEANLDFTLRGRCAGQAKINGDGTTTLRINQPLLEENQAEFLARTIPHEVAHLVVNWQTGKRKSSPKPHGAEWQQVMRDCFGLTPQRCHNYQTTPARIVPRPFLYTCDCQEHLLTALMHRKISRASAARCKRCKTDLHFAEHLNSHK